MLRGDIVQQRRIIKDVSLEELAEEAVVEEVWILEEESGGS